MLEIIGGILILSLLVLFSGIKAVKEHNALVIYRFGKVSRQVGSGLQWVMPLLESADTVDTRIVTLPIAAVSETSMDHFPVKVSALCMFQVADPKKGIGKVQDVVLTTGQICEVTLRGIISQTDVRHLLSDRTRINWNFKTQLDRRLKEYGVRVASIEINEVKLTRDAYIALATKAGRDSNGRKLIGTKEEGPVSVEAMMNAYRLFE